MSEKEIIDLFDERIINKKYTNKLYFNPTLFVILVTLTVLVFFKTVIECNELKKEVKGLTFCIEIYKSDHVVLEQCKDYFVISNNKEV